MKQTVKRRAGEPAVRRASQLTVRHAPKATATAIALDSRHRKRAPSQLDAEQMLLQMFCGEPPRGE